jgi:hypothetical protein
MRWVSLILVGISALGCGNKDASKPAQGSAGPTTTATTHQVAPHAPALPTDKSATERAPVHDEAWRTETAKTIQAVAPDLTNVTCHQIDCSATLTAANQDELVARAEHLQTDDSLHQLDDARGVVLSAPVQKDGKTSMTIRILFDQ